MSELIEEDIIGGCTRAPMAVLGCVQPMDFASLHLVYSISSEVKEIARWIRELSSSQSSFEISQDVDLVGLSLTYL
jgi:hypothetical protein